MFKKDFMWMRLNNKDKVFCHYFAKLSPVNVRSNVLRPNYKQSLVEVIILCNVHCHKIHFLENWPKF